MTRSYCPPQDKIPLLVDVLRALAVEGVMVTRGCVVEYLGWDDSLAARRYIALAARTNGWSEWRGESNRWLVPPQRGEQ
jgi:hypothetical protein